MKVEYAFVCDAATMLPNGTFDVIAGGFLEVAGHSFPSVKSTIVFIARLSFAPQECGKQYEFFGEITNKEGQRIYPQFQGTFTPPLHARSPNRENWFTVCLSAERVEFPAPGEYFFRLSIGGKIIGEVMIEAVLEDKPR